MNNAERCKMLKVGCKVLVVWIGASYEAVVEKIAEDVIVVRPTKYYRSLTALDFTTQVVPIFDIRVIESELDLNPFYQEYFNSKAEKFYKNEILKMSFWSKLKFLFGGDKK